MSTQELFRQWIAEGDGFFRMGRPGAEIVLARHAESLTPVLRRLAHPGTYYSAQIAGGEYRALRPLLAQLGLELLRDEQVLSYRGMACGDLYNITVTYAGMARLDALTRDMLVCPRYLEDNYQAARANEDLRWIVAHNAAGEPEYAGEPLRVLDAGNYAECCGNFLISAQKRIPCPTCGRILCGD